MRTNLFIRLIALTLIPAMLQTTVSGSNASVKRNAKLETRSVLFASQALAVRALSPLQGHRHLAFSNLFGIQTPVVATGLGLLIFAKTGFALDGRIPMQQLGLSIGSLAVIGVPALGLGAYGLHSLRKKFKMTVKDRLFLGCLLTVFVAGSVLDFNYLHVLVEQDPRFETFALLVMSVLCAAVSDLSVQWSEMKERYGDFIGSLFQIRRVWNLVGTGAYSATIERLIYIPVYSVLTGLLTWLGCPPVLAAVLVTVLDLVWISPRLTERLAYYVYAHYLEGVSEEEALQQIADNGLEVYVHASPVWFLTTSLSLMTHNLIVRFFCLSLGVLYWNLVFSSKAGEKKSDMLEKWGRHRIGRFFVPFLNSIQESYERPGQASFLKKWLFGLAATFGLRELYIWNVPVPVLLILGVIAVVVGIMRNTPPNPPDSKGPISLIADAFRVVGSDLHRTKPSRRSVTHATKGSIKRLNEAT